MEYEASTIVQWREAERQMSVRETDLLKERSSVIGKLLSNRKGLQC
jgi:hypothetical protein